MTNHKDDCAVVYMAMHCPLCNDNYETECVDDLLVPDSMLHKWLGLHSGHGCQIRTKCQNGCEDKFAGQVRN